MDDLPPDPELLVRHKIDVDDYHRMAEMGILRREDRVELIGGEIIDVSPLSANHAGCVDQMAELLATAFAERAIVGVQRPVRLDRLSEPEPDISIPRRDPDFFCAGHPGPRDVLLLIEVAASSAAHDRRIKAPLYAHKGIAEFWIIDLNARKLIRHREPSESGYRDIAFLDRGETVSPLAAPDIRLEVSTILG